MNRGFRLEYDGHAWSERDVLQSGRAELRELGLAVGRPREPIAVDAANRLSFIRAFLAVRSHGLAIVPMPEGLDEAERERRLLVADVRQSIRTIPGRPELMVGAAPGSGASLPTEYLVFTSGTEGPAKGVLLSEEGFRLHAQACAPRLGATNESRWLLSLSPAHVGGLALLTRSLEQGSTVVVPKDRLPDDLDAPLTEGRISHVSLVPTQLHRWMRARKARTAPPHLRCVLVGGGPSPPELIDVARTAGLPVFATYGLTETSSQVATAGPDDPPDSVGRPLPGTEVKILEGPEPGPGRIAVRGPALFRGYHRDPAATDAAMRDGWFVTQDLGVLDGQGRLFAMGRAGRIINTGGLKVDPARVEAALLAHDDVLEAAVVARPDPDLGQRIVAFVVAARPVKDEELRGWCRERLAAHEVPKSVEVVPSLPRSASGKVDLARIR